MRPRIVILLVALVGCESIRGGGGASSGSAGSLTESGTKRGSAGGFAATMAQELGAPEGSLGAAAPNAPPPSAAPATATMPVTAPAPAPATATATATATTPAAGTTAAAAANAKGSAAPVAAGSAAAKGSAAPVAAGSAAAKGSAAPVAVAATKPAAGAPAGNAPTAGAPAAPASAPAPAPAAKSGSIAAAPGLGKAILDRKPVKPSAELAAIKLDLEPNWDRDYGEAGTVSLVVKVPNTEDTRVLGVRYGYEDPAAPVDCDQYRKFLEDKKIMTVTVNRQRGGACYIESKDSFRYLVNFGGKRLLCTGSLYKDATTASLGDLRDKVLMQAKKICETLAL